MKKSCTPCINWHATHRSANHYPGNVLTCANKTSGTFWFIKKSLTCLTKEILLPVYSVLMQPHLENAIQPNCPYLKKDINHLERTQRAAAKWMRGLRGLIYEERLKTLKPQFLVKEEMLWSLNTRYFNQIDWEVTLLLKFSRRPGKRRSSLRLLRQTGRTRRRRTNLHTRLVSTGTICYFFKKVRTLLTQMCRFPGTELQARQKSIKKQEEINVWPFASIVFWIDVNWN